MCEGGGETEEVNGVNGMGEEKVGVFGLTHTERWNLTLEKMTQMH